MVVVVVVVAAVVVVVVVVARLWLRSPAASGRVLRTSMMAMHQAFLPLLQALEDGDAPGLAAGHRPLRTSLALYLAEGAKVP